MSDTDVDGDGIADPIRADFSGGAHCCYTLTVQLSRRSSPVSFPFELDGGYIQGLDLSQPARFSIADYDADGIADVCAQIETYNGEESPIPKDWQNGYGFHTNWVIISFANHPGVRDEPARTCDPNVINRGA